LATRGNDDEKTREVADLWLGKFGVANKPQNIIFDGCLTEGGNLFFYCEVCRIRKCGRGTGIIKYA
jgi:hypothetical protein